MSSDEVRHCDSDSDPPGPRGDGGQGGEGFWGGCGFRPVEQMVVYEDAVEAVFFAELCSPDNFLKRFIVGEEEPASESDPFLHLVFPEGILAPSGPWPQVILKRWRMNDLA